MRTVMKRILLVIVAIALVTSTSLLNSMGSEALSGSQFKAGRIIDDAVFFNPNAMTASQIQAFLDAKVPVCDTNHAYSGSANDSGAPYICLKDYRQNIPKRNPEDGLCNGITAASNQTAAQIIDKVARSCGVSQKVLIVLLQKEQSLVTDVWPWDIQYRSATGYGCPDTAPCDSEYYGFFNQVYNAARIYKYYAKYSNSFNHIPRVNNNIRYHPNAACGSSPVFIENQSTAGLYNYTPYQPNSAALNNLYGTGNGCSAYGNRNFWRIFSDWFGSTQTNIPYAWLVDSVKYYTDEARTKLITKDIVYAEPGQKIYVELRARNTGFETWKQDIVKLGTSSPADRDSSFASDDWLTIHRPASLQEAEVEPTGIGTFIFSLKVPSSSGGPYVESFRLLAEGKAWMQGANLESKLQASDPRLPVESTRVLGSGEAIRPGDELVSQDLHTTLAFQTDGNIVINNDFLPVWSTSTNGKGTDRLVMQYDGNLVAYDSENKAVWASGTNGNPGASMRLQTDGNLVIYKANGTTPAWSSSTNLWPTGLSYTRPTAYLGSILYPGQSLITPNHAYRLTMQYDGNFVLYNASNTPLWSTKTNKKSAAFAFFQQDGNTVIYKDDGTSVWASKTNGKNGQRFTLQYDGNIVIYDNQQKAVWASGTNR